jgi:kumamolisin
MPNRKMFPDSVIPLPAGAGVTPQGLTVNAAQPHHRSETMDLSFTIGVPPAAEKELEERVEKGDVISPEELKAKYSADPAAANTLQTWLKGEGFTVKEVSADNTTIYASATASQIEASLGVHVVTVTQQGQTYTAASDVPSLPDSVAGAVVHIGGLQPFRQARKHLRSRRALPQDEESARPAIANAPPYLVSEIVRAYDDTGLSLTGAGQEIAILIDTFPADKDVTAFWTLNKIAGSLSRITKINVKGTTPPAPSGEESLDVEWSSGIAPNANIRVYASGTLSFVDLDKALDRIIADAMTRKTMRVLSISLGLSEGAMAKQEVATEESKFLRLAALGVNVFVSTGDDGSSPNGQLNASWMSTSPHVIAVGGTSLRLSANGQVANETGWAGSGGGKSIFFPLPSWQTGPGVPPGNQRMVPDVGATADPNEGGLVILHGARQQYGGTSWSAPVWAAFCALLNEARQRNAKAPIGYLNPYLYKLNGSNCFRDITSGSNGAYSCTPGYDLVTGIGTPDVKQLIAKLS